MRGVDLPASENGAGRTAFLRGLLSRGLPGESSVISSKPPSGLKEAIASCLPGATWQRRRTPFARDLLTRVSKSPGLVAACGRTVFAKPDKKSVLRQRSAAVERLEPRFPEARGRRSPRHAKTSWPSPPSPRRTGERSGPEVRSSGSTER